MNKDIFSMSQKELNQLHVIRKVIEKELKQVEASAILGLSERHVRRIVKRVRVEGDLGILHRGRGQISHQKITEQERQKVLRIYQKQYWDFGPTLACEKLKENHKIKLSKETLRQWLIKEGLWKRQRKGRKHRQQRERKKFYGQMVQLDGSHHDWLEGRCKTKMVLMGYIDDATNKMYGRFYEYEGTVPAMESLQRYVKRNGKPQSVYVDKHTTYRSHDRDRWKAIMFGEESLSQFERGCKELGITVIHAHSPQAKGRVERLFKTLQDRLVKELRLAGAKTIEQANKVLDQYIKQHNKQFSVQALERKNLHQKVNMKQVNDALCVKTERTVRNDFTIAHNRAVYQIKKYTPDKKIKVWDRLGGSMEIHDKYRRLPYKKISKNRLKQVAN